MQARSYIKFHHFSLSHYIFDTQVQRAKGKQNWRRVVEIISTAAGWNNIIYNSIPRQATSS